jgi:hypothetical protein
VIKTILEGRVGHLSNAEWEIIAKIVTDDLKFNRVNFKKCTSLEYVLGIAVSSAKIFRKCA